MNPNAAALNLMFDVSDNNGTIDWAALAAEFPNGAVVEIKASQGLTEVDSQFEANYNAAKALGWGVIPYHFCTVDDPEAQWKHFASAAQLMPGDAYMLDWERYDGEALSTAQMDALGQAGFAEIGRLPIGYWSEPNLGASPAIPSSYMMTWNWHAARYRRANDPNWQNDPRPNYMNQTAAFLQYTEWGRLAGIGNGTSDVDRSVIYNFDTIAEAIAFCSAASSV